MNSLISFFPCSLAPSFPPPAPSSTAEPVPGRQVTNLVMNFGPQHPAAHGVLRLVVQINGEVGGCTPSLQSTNPPSPPLAVLAVVVSGVGQDVSVLLCCII